MQVRHETPIDAACAEVIARLDHRPAGWLRPFLQLARQPGAAGPVGWYRLDPLDETYSARLRWRPPGPDDLFDRFDGHLRLRRRDDQVVLVVDGSVEGGEPDRNRRAVATLATTLGAALAGDHRSG